jgi:hypothetical protein
MRSTHFRRLARLGTGALVLFLVQGFGAPPSAWAGCTHPAASQSDPYRDLYRIDTLFMGGASSPADDGLTQSPLEPPARRSPCSGLSCSSRDPLPTSTTAPAVEGSQQWGSLGGMRVVIRTTSLYSRALDEPAPADAGDKTSIFHPPRV